MEDISTKRPRRRTLNKMFRARITETGMSAGGPGIFLTAAVDAFNKTAVYRLSYFGPAKVKTKGGNEPKPWDKKKDFKEGSPTIVFRPSQIDRLIEELTQMKAELIKRGFRHEDV